MHNPARAAGRRRFKPGAVPLGDRIRDGLQVMQTRGDLPAGTDPEQLALATLAALQGGLLVTQLERDTRPLEAALDAMLDRIQTPTGAD
jgi:TetR/AcrR family transcriptional regulator, transcriptional repressor for nem operon